MSIENLADKRALSPSLPSPAASTSTLHDEIAEETSPKPIDSTLPSTQRPRVRSSPIIQPTSTTAAAAARPEGGFFSPPLAAILNAYNADGAGDRELLKILLLAKTKEDERLAAHDQFRAEQLRAATTLAQQAAYWYSAQLQSPMSPHLNPSAANASYYPQAPHSPPLSPPDLRASPTSPFGVNPLKRQGSPAESTTSSTASSSSGPSAAKKSKPPTKHEEAMAALRAKCQRNKAAHLVPPPRATALVSSIRSTTPTVAVTASSPAPSPAPAPTPAPVQRPPGGSSSISMLLNAAAHDSVSV